MAKIVLNTGGVERVVQQVYEASMDICYEGNFNDTFSGYESCPSSYRGGYVEKWNTKEEKYETKWDSDKYSTAVSNYNAALSGLETSANSIREFGYKVMNFYSQLNRILRSSDTYKSAVASMFSADFMASSLNTLANRYGFDGAFVVDYEGENKFGDVLYKFTDENGEVKYMTLGELTNSFVTFSSTTILAEAVYGTEENQKTVYNVGLQSHNLRENTGMYKITDESQAAAFIKETYKDKYPELADVDPKDDKAMDKIRDIMDLEDPSSLYGGPNVTGVAAAGLGLIFVDAAVADLAYSITPDGKVNIDYDHGYREIDTSHLTYDESRYTDPSITRDKKDHVDPAEGEGLPESNPKGNDRPEENPNRKRNDESGRRDEDRHRDDDKDQDQEVLGDEDGNPAEEPGPDGKKDPGESQPEDSKQPGDESKPEDGSKEGETTAPEDRKSIKDMTSYDDVVDGYLEAAGDADALEPNKDFMKIDYGDNFDQSILEELSDSDSEVKTASILALVAEANNLFDTNKTLLSSKLIEMGYTDEQVAQIIQDRELTVDAFTKKANENVYDDDKPTGDKKLDAKRKLKKSVDNYKKAIDEANESLSTAKELKDKMNEFTAKYGEDTSKWTDEQYEEYSKLAEEYNSAVATAKEKINSVNEYKESFESAKKDYLEVQKENTIPEDTSSEGMDDPSSIVGQQDDVKSEGMDDIPSDMGIEQPGDTSSQGLETPDKILDDIKSQVTGSDTVASDGIDDPMDIMGDNGTQSTNVDEAVRKSVEDSSSILSEVNANSEATSDSVTEVSSEGMEPVIGDNTIDVSNLDSDTSHMIDIDDAPTTSVKSSTLSNIGQNIASGIKNNMSAELISVGVVVAIKGANKLLNGNSKQKFVINYDELAKYKYEKIPKEEREFADNNISNEARELFAVNKDMLADRLREYGYSTLDISKICTSEDLAVKAMLDGSRRSRLASIATELAAEDGITTYQSGYVGQSNVLDLENGVADSLAVDLVDDAEFDKLRNDYFALERQLADSANTANRDLELLNKAKSNYDKFIGEHGSDTGSWSNDEYNAYQQINDANIAATKDFDESSKRLEDIGTIFADMRTKYEKEKTARIMNKVDATNIKEMINQPVMNTM